MEFGGIKKKCSPHNIFFITFARRLSIIGFVLDVMFS